MSKGFFIASTGQHVGKTTLSLKLLGSPNTDTPAYLTWDDREDRERILSAKFPPDQKIIVLAVLHARRDPSLWQKRK